MLKLGGIINIIIAIAHIFGLLWADQMFKVTGIGNEMAHLSKIHESLPFLLTFIVAIVFFVFGLYAFSAIGKIKKMPFLKLGVFGISAIYLFRGIGELAYNFTQQNKPSILETTYSLIAIGIGLIFLLGGYKKWVK